MRKKIGKEVIVGSCRKREKFKGIKVEGTKKRIRKSDRMKTKSCPAY